MGDRRERGEPFKDLDETGGEQARVDIRQRTPLVNNRVPAPVDQAVGALAIEHPARGQVRVSQALLQRGVIVSPGGGRSSWRRHDGATLKKRLKALEATSAQDRIWLTDKQRAALETVTQQRESHGDIEAEPPGCLGR